MARKRDILCAGTCGRLIWRGKGCLPEGRAMCKPCRAQRRGELPPTSLCANAGCGRAFVPRATDGGRNRGKPTKTCSESCRIARMVAANGGRERPHPCPDSCGQMVTGHVFKRCEACRAVRLQARNRRKNMARRGVSPCSTMTLRQLGDRDRWRCHLCGRSVDPKLRVPDRMAGTFDHLIPVADRSDDPDASSNLRLAHHSCNSRRGTGGVVQLLLFG